MILRWQKWMHDISKKANKYSLKIQTGLNFLVVFLILMVCFHFFKKKAMEKGMNGHISKPLDVEKWRKFYWIF